MNDKRKYTTLFVTKALKQRLDAIAAAQRRTPQQQIEYWCDQEADATSEGKSQSKRGEECPKSDQPASF